MALRRSSLLLSRALLSRSSLETLTKTPQLQINPTTFSSSSSTISNHNLFFSPSRSFCSSSEPSPSNFVVVKSEEEFNTSLNKAQGDSLPAIFYFTASWCGPCKLISPIIQELSKNYPNLTTYKIDVDQKELQSTLENLKIYSVPTLHFFKDGKKANEMVGTDVGFLNQTMESLYKEDPCSHMIVSGKAMAERADNLFHLALFPDNAYGFDSCGDPRNIPKLTFEEFKDFHRKYYHPSNARIWFYGDDDTNERLRILSGNCDSPLT